MLQIPIPVAGIPQQTTVTASAPQPSKHKKPRNKKRMGVSVCACMCVCVYVYLYMYLYATVQCVIFKGRNFHGLGSSGNFVDICFVAYILSLSYLTNKIQ